MWPRAATAPLPTSQGYASKASALGGIASVKNNAPGAEIVELEK